MQVVGWLVAGELVAWEKMGDGMGEEGLGVKDDQVGVIGEKGE